MRLPTTTQMVKSLEEISGDLTDQERAALAPISAVMRSGQVTRLSNEQVEALDAMYSAYFGSTANA